jgi:hypothetical protein
MWSVVLWRAVDTNPRPTEPFRLRRTRRRHRRAYFGFRISSSEVLLYCSRRESNRKDPVPGVRPARGSRAGRGPRARPARRVGRARPGARGRGPRGAAPPRLRHPRGTIARVKRGKRKAANAGRRVTSEQLSARESCGQTAVPVGPARRVLDVLYSVLSVLEVTVNGISRISHLADSIDAPSGRMCGRRLRSCILWTPLLALCWRLKTRHSSSDIAAA